MQDCWGKTSCSTLSRMLPFSLVSFLTSASEARDPMIRCSLPCSTNKLWKIWYLQQISIDVTWKHSACKTLTGVSGYVRAVAWYALSRVFLSRCRILYRKDSNISILGCILLLIYKRDEPPHLSEYYHRTLKGIWGWFPQSFKTSLAVSVLPQDGSRRNANRTKGFRGTP